MPMYFIVRIVAVVAVVLRSILTSDEQAGGW